MIGEIANAKGTLNVFRHTGTGPKIGWESCRLRALEQVSFQPTALARREFKRPSACRDRFQCNPTANLQIMLPTADTARIHIEAARDLSLGDPLFQQPDGMLTLTLQLFWTALRSDKSPPHNNNRIGHY